MPQYPRRCRAWDWLTQPHINHLPVEKREALMKVAEEFAARDRVPRKTFRWALVVFLVSLVLDYSRFDHKFSPSWSRALEASLLVFALGLIFWGNLRRHSKVRLSLREQLLVRHICPACCFECGAFTEGCDDTDCPVCGVRLVEPRS